jgi:hypothetical protein
MGVAGTFSVHAQHATCMIVDVVQAMGLLLR